MNTYSRVKTVTWLPHLLVGLVYLFFTVYYMGPSVTNCADTLYGFGDNTAGPIWRFTVSPDSPLWGYQNVTNYPVGENLYSPVHYSGLIQYTLFWSAAKVFGPLCGYNIINIIGFMASALVMYGFIYAITKNRWIAMLAGYAVAFSPYYQMKVGGHPSYGYQALLIGLVWAFYNLITKWRRRDIAYVGVLTASCFYFDPYFSLLAVCCISALGLVWGTYEFLRLRKGVTQVKETLKKLKYLAMSAVVAFALIAPLVTITIAKSQEIKSSVAAVRGNVLFEATACSNLPHEYILPFVLHPIFGKLLGMPAYQNLIDDLHGGFDCGIGEDTVGISITVLTVVLAGLIILLWEKINKRRFRAPLKYGTGLLVAGLLGIAIVGVLMALPPIKIGKISTPSYVLLMITTTWRTLTRFYLIVNFATIALFSVILAIMAAHFKKHKRELAVIFCLLFFAVFVEYQAFKPFAGNSLSTFSYSKDVPDAYEWLKDQKDINEIAEYPLERAGGESNAMAYYLSMQIVHKKKLFNGNIPTTPEEDTRGSLKDLADPQTVRVLGSIGIDAVVIHGVEEAEVRQIPGLEVIYSTPQSPFNILAYTPLVKSDTMVIARISKSSQKQMLNLGKGFVRNATIIRSSLDWEYEATDKSEINITPLPGSTAKPDKASKQCFKVKMASPGDSDELFIYIDGVKTNFGKIVDTYRLIELEAKDTIRLSTINGHNLRVSDLGCKENL